MARILRRQQQQLHPRAPVLPGLELGPVLSGGASADPRGPEQRLQGLVLRLAPVQMLPHLPPLGQALGLPGDQQGFQLLGGAPSLPLQIPRRQNQRLLVEALGLPARVKAQQLLRHRGGRRAQAGEHLPQSGPLPLVLLQLLGRAQVCPRRFFNTAST